MIILAVLLIVFFGLSLTKPIWSYGLILAVLPIYVWRLQINNIPTTVLELMVGVFLFAVLIKFANREIWRRLASLGGINYAVGFFLLAAAIGTFVSPEKARALGQLKAFFIEPVLMFYAGTLLYRKTSDFILPLRILFGSATAISVFGIIQYWTHLFLPLRFWGYGLEVKRITSVFEYPNALALYLAPIFLLFLTLLVKKYWFTHKYWHVFGLVCIFFALTLTSSRGAWLGMAAAATVLALQLSRITLRRWAITAAVALLLISPFIYNRTKIIFHDASSAERVQLFKIAGDKILHDPIFGNGLAGFKRTLVEANYQGELLNYPHNIILNFWTEIGLLGILSFAGIIFLSLRQYRLMPNSLKLGAALFLLALVVHGLVDAPYFKNDLSVLFWSILPIFYVKE